MSADSDMFGGNAACLIGFFLLTDNEQRPGDGGVRGSARDA
jgi:hypothetical protein